MRAPHRPIGQRHRTNRRDVTLGSQIQTILTRWTCGGGVVQRPRSNIRRSSVMLHDTMGSSAPRTGVCGTRAKCLITGLNLCRLIPTYASHFMTAVSELGAVEQRELCELNSVLSSHVGLDTFVRAQRTALRSVRAQLSRWLALQYTAFWRSRLSNSGCKTLVQNRNQLQKYN